MKTEHFKPYITISKFMTLWSLIFCACSSNDDTPAPVFSYASDTFEVSFRTQGTIPPPNIEWAGNVGTFTLKENIQGLTIDESSGALSWERQLGIGEHVVEITAQNDQRTLETSFLLTNVLRSAFWSAGRNNDIDSNEIDFDRYFTFFPDGTLETALFGEPDSKGVGVWELEGSSLSMHFCAFCEDMDPFSIPEYDEHTYYEGALVNEESVAFISGQWFVIRFDPDSESLRGNFYMEWD